MAGCGSPLPRRRPLQACQTTGTMAAMKHIQRESLIHDPIHGYIPFISVAEPSETAERTLLDHPWLQRLRQIHQLQTAWWVYP